MTSTRTAAAPQPRSVNDRDEFWLLRALHALARFFREVVSEMRKVLWPTRNELVTYTIVVIVFVVILVAIVAGLDAGFARLVLALFG